MSLAQAHQVPLVICSCRLVAQQWVRTARAFAIAAEQADAITVADLSVDPEMLGALLQGRHGVHLRQEQGPRHRRVPG